MDTATTWIPEICDAVRSGDRVFRIIKRAQIRVNGKLTDIALYDEQGTKHLASKCTPATIDEPLADWELAIVVSMCRAMIETNDFSDVELLDNLTPRQCRQVFEAIGHAPALYRAINDRKQAEDDDEF